MCAELCECDGSVLFIFHVSCLFCLLIFTLPRLTEVAQLCLHEYIGTLAKVAQLCLHEYIGTLTEVAQLCLHEYIGTLAKVAQLCLHEYIGTLAVVAQLCLSSRHNFVLAQAKLLYLVHA